MKKLFILLTIMLYMLLSFGQKVSIDKNGNYISTIKVEDRNSGKYFVDDQGYKHPIYITSNEKMYYYKRSITGKTYKVYIKKSLDVFDKSYSITILNEHEVVLIYKTDTVRLYFENAYKLSEENVVFVDHK